MFDRHQQTHLGDAVDVVVPAPFALTVGLPLILGDTIPAVSANKVPAGEDAVFLCTGRHLWRKANDEAWTLGQPLYLNTDDPEPANRFLTPTFPTAPGRYLVFGVAWANVAATESYGAFKPARELTYLEVT